MAAWYRTGTIGISGKTVTGAGTNWTDNKFGIGPGQALLVPADGDVKIYEIARVDSATQLTLVADAGSVAAGSEYAIMSFYTDSRPDFARRLSAQLGYYQSLADDLQIIMTGTGSVTITAPDDTPVTISSFKKLTEDMAGKATLVNGVLPVEQGGTGANGDTGARKNLGLGTAATKDANSLPIATTGYLMLEGTGGWWSYIGIPGATDGRYNERSGIYAGPGASGVNYFDSYAPMLVINRYQNLYSMLQISPTNGRSAVRGRNGDAYTSWLEIYTTGNTTKASDGTLKAASPVARIVKSQNDTERKDIAEDGFIWCGAGTCNEEAEGITISREDVGIYSVTGATGLASEGWRLLPPKDPEGGATLGIVEAEESEEKITIRLFARKYALVDGDIVEVKGDPIDVPENSWIDVRLDMPENSIWNQKQQPPEQTS
jgi:hypothetical protein